MPATSTVKHHFLTRLEMIAQQDEDIDISVVICSHNRADGLHSTLRSIINQETHGAFRFEIVVIHTDTPGTVAAIESVASISDIPIRSVKELRRGGVIARNRGIQEAKGEWLALFDDDQEADPRWLKALWDVAHKHNAKNVGGSLRLQLPQNTDTKFSLMCRRLLGETAPWKVEREYTAQEGPGTGNQMIHRSVFELVGNWDESFTLRGYDSEFYSRMRQAGVRSWFTPYASGVHIIPESRLTQEFFKELGLHNGWQFARRDLLAHGTASTLARSVARLAQSMLWHFPALLLALFTKNQQEQLDRKVKIWRAEGYCRSFLYAVAPWIHQRSFFSKHEFRVSPNGPNQFRRIEKGESN
jgi:GT2 family glycosyltransferase